MNLPDSPSSPEPNESQRKESVRKKLQELIDKYKNLESFFESDLGKTVKGLTGLFNEINSVKAESDILINKKNKLANQLTDEESADELLIAQVDELHREVTTRIEEYLSEKKDETEKEKKRQQIEYFYFVRQLLTSRSLDSLLSILSGEASSANEKIGQDARQYSTLIGQIVVDFNLNSYEELKENSSREFILTKLSSIENEKLRNYICDLLTQSAKENLEDKIIFELQDKSSSISKLSELISLLESYSQDSQTVKSMLEALQKAKDDIDNQKLFVVLANFSGYQQAELRGLAEKLLESYKEEETEKRKLELEGVVKELRDALSEKLAKVIPKKLQEAFIDDEIFLQLFDAASVDPIQRMSSKIIESLLAKLESFDFSGVTAVAVKKDLSFLDDYVDLYISRSTPAEMSQQTRDFLKEIVNTLSSELAAMEKVVNHIQVSSSEFGRLGVLSPVFSDYFDNRQRTKETSDKFNERKVQEIRNSIIQVLIERNLASNDKLLQRRNEVVSRIGFQKNAYLDISKDLDPEIYDLAKQEAVDYLVLILGYDRNELDEEINSLSLPADLTAVVKLIDGALVDKNGKIELLDPKFQSDEIAEERHVGYINIPDEVDALGKSYSWMKPGRTAGETYTAAQKKEKVINLFSKGKLTFTFDGFIDGNNKTSFRERIINSSLFKSGDLQYVNLKIDVGKYLSEEVQKKIIAQAEQSYSQDEIIDLIYQSLNKSPLVKKLIEEVNNFVEGVVTSIVRDPGDFLSKTRISMTKEVFSHADWLAVIITLVKGKFESASDKPRNPMPMVSSVKIEDKELIRLVTAVSSMSL